MRAPYREDLTGIDIGLIGVPFDGGVTNRTGARHGPREIRNQSSLMRRVNQATRIDPYACAGSPISRCLGRKAVRAPGRASRDRGGLAAVHHAGCRGIVPVSAGGRSFDHPADLRAIASIARSHGAFRRRIATRDDYLGSKFTSGGDRFGGRSRRGCSIQAHVRSAIRGGVDRGEDRLDLAMRALELERLFDPGIADIGDPAQGIGIRCGFA